MEKLQTNNKTSIVQILTIIFSAFCIIACGGETTSTSAFSTPNEAPQPNSPDDSAEVPVEEQDLEKTIKIYVPNFVAGELHVEQESLQFTFSQSFAFSDTTPNESRWVEVTVPNKLFEYDVLVEEATYDDPATGNTITFSDEHVIKSIIPDEYAEDQISVTVFTHLAKSAYDFYSGNVTWYNIDTAYREYLGLDTFLSLVPIHSGIPYSVNIQDHVRYGFWIAAFSKLAELAEDFQDKVHNDNSNLTVKGLLHHLAIEDIGNDGVFSSNGGYDSFDFHHQTMRLQLAQGLYQFVGSSQNNTNYDQSAILSQNITNSVTLCDNNLIFSSSYNDLHVFNPSTVSGFCTYDAFPGNVFASAAEDINYECEADSELGIFVFRGYSYIYDIENDNVISTKTLHSTTNQGFDDDYFFKHINLSPYDPTPSPFSYSIQAEVYVYDYALNYSESVYPELLIIP